MNSTLSINELTFALVINNYDLNLSHTKFLQSSGVVSNDWTLARQPIANQQVTQTVFGNGINIIGQPHRCLIAEIFEGKSIEECQSPEVVQKYLDKLSHLDYQAIGLNFRAYLELEPQEFFKKLIAAGDWQQHGIERMQTELKFVYQFEHSRCTLTIDEGKLRQPDSEALPIVVFSGNFAYKFSDRELDNRMEAIKKIVSNWNNDLETFNNIINDFPQVAKKQELVAV